MRAKSPSPFTYLCLWLDGRDGEVSHKGRAPDTPSHVQVLGAIVITEFSKEFYDYLMLPPPAVDYVRPPHYLSTDPVIAAKPYAGLGFQIGALQRYCSALFAVLSTGNFIV